MARSFRIGGVHPPDSKLSHSEAIVRMPVPEQVVILTGQHIGASAVATVAKGDKVKVGQVVATAAGFVSANVHASCSGEVVAVDMVADCGGIKRPAITIKTEGDEWAEGIDRSESLKQECQLPATEIVKKIAAAGIVGMGGATFPTQVKLSVPEGKKAEYLIINGVECEPYLTSDHRVMLERGHELLIGVRILARALGVGRSFVGIEENKPDAIEHLRTLAAGYPEIEVVALKVHYPQGGEKQLIDAVLRRQVPSGGLPLDVGAVVQNVGTALAVYEAVQKDKPLVERVVTVTGKGMRRPTNVLVRVGTPVSEVIKFCGGVPEGTGKVINGGPMMGRAVSHLDAPVTKGTSGILLMEAAEAARPAAGVCIKCAKCVKACPMGLEPYMLSRLGERGMFAESEAYHATDCIECGSCSFTCPAALPLLDYIRLGKAEVMKIIRNRK
jgi:electron transport complex protein RnfC